MTNPRPPPPPMCFICGKTKNIRDSVLISNPFSTKKEGQQPPVSSISDKLSKMTTFEPKGNGNYVCKTCQGKLATLYKRAKDIEENVKLLRSKSASIPTAGIFTMSAVPTTFNSCVNCDMNEDKIGLGKLRLHLLSTPYHSQMPETPWGCMLKFKELFSKMMVFTLAETYKNVKLCTSCRQPLKVIFQESNSLVNLLNSAFKGPDDPHFEIKEDYLVELASFTVPPSPFQSPSAIGSTTRPFHSSSESVEQESSSQNPPKRLRGAHPSPIGPFSSPRPGPSSAIQHDNSTFSLLASSSEDLSLQPSQLTTQRPVIIPNLRFNPSSIEDLVAKLESELEDVKRFFNQRFLSNMDTGLMNFSFETILSHVAGKCPHLHWVLRKLSRKDQLDQKTMVSISVLLFSHNVSYCLLQRFLGIILWKCGLKKKALEWLNHLGITMSYSTINDNVRELAKTCEKAAESWKTDVEKALTTPSLEDPPRFVTTFDNLNFYQRARFLGNRFNVLHNWTAAVLVKVRIPFDASQITPPRRQPLALLDDELRSTQFYLTESELLKLETERLNEFKRIAVEHIGCFKTFKKFIPNRDIPPNVVEKSKARSEFFPLGVLDLNEATIEGCTGVLDHLNKWIPKYSDGRRLDTVVAGDYMTVERVWASQKSRRHVSNPDDLLNHFYTAEGDFHLMMVKVEDFWKEFNYPGSRSSKGSLASIVKVLFGKLTGEAKNNYYPMYECTQVILRGLTTLALMNELKINDKDARPPGFDLEDEVECKKIFDNAVLAVANMAKFRVYEPCTKNKLVCKCKQPCGNKEMIICSNRNCEIRWFHLDCIPPHGLPEKPKIILKKAIAPWYCSDACKNAAGDKKFYYSRSMMYEAMGIRVRNEAIRENDGPMILMHWKEDQVSFVNRNHINYAKLGIVLLVSQGGCVPPMIAHDLKWNRTVNVKGLPSKNIPLDLLCEHMIRFIKDQLRELGGDKTLEAVQTRVKLYYFLNILENRIVEITKSSDVSSTHKKRNYQQDVGNFISAYFKEDLVKSSSAPRCHSGMQNFNYDPCLQKQDKYDSSVMKVVGDLQDIIDAGTHFQSDGPIDALDPEAVKKSSWSRLFTKYPSFSYNLETVSVPEMAEFPKMWKPYTFQYNVSKGFLENDVMISLPHHGGKTTIFALANILSALAPTNTEVKICIIVTPHKTRIPSYIQKLNGFGLPAYEYIEDTIQLNIEAHTGRVPIFVFLDMDLLETITVASLCADIDIDSIVFFDAHFVKSWSDKAKQFFRQVSGTYRIGVCSAVLTKEHKKEFFDLGLDKNCDIFFKRPQWPNVHLIFQKHNPANISNVINRICSTMQKYKTFPKTLIIVKSMPKLNETVSSFLKVLRADAYASNNRSLSTLMVRGYHDNLKENGKKDIELEFMKPDSIIRVLIAIESNALSLQVSDIRLLVNLSEKSQKLWEHANMVGRDRHPAVLVTLCPDVPVSCPRKSLEEYKIGDELSSLGVDASFTCDKNCSLCKCSLCVCCDNCKRACNCKGRQNFLDVIFG